MSKRIKVCNIITKLELGGAQISTLYSASHLNRTAFDSILISGAGGILDDEARRLDRVRTFFVDNLVRPINPLKDLLALFAVWRILRQERPQVVHTHTSKAGMVGRWAAFFARVPAIVHTFHGCAFHDFQPLPVKWAYIFLEVISAQLAQKLIVVTREHIRKCLRYSIGSENKYLVIRAGIDVKKYSTPSAPSASRAALDIAVGVPVVTTIGSFLPAKNLPDFIRVAALVKKQVPTALFLVVGDGLGRRQLEAMTREHGMSDSLRLLGWRRDIDRILAASDLFVMTSLWEGLPCAILEAMCMGLPVVANGVDGVREIIAEGETGHLIEPRDIVTMAEKIVKLLTSPELRRRYGTAAKRRISEEFDINYVVRQQEELYRQLYR